jgi:hypothetical protein
MAAASSMPNWPVVALAGLLFGAFLAWIDHLDRR